MANENRQKYASLSTYELIKKIVEDCDVDVRNYLMDFRRIIQHGKRWLLIPEYIQYLSLNRISFMDYRPDNEENEEFEQIVNDLTQARFIEFSKEHSRGEGCLNQYRHILKVVRESDELENSIKIEQLISVVMEKTITRHFYLCIKEGQRQINPFQIRYDWKRDGKMIMKLYRPTTVGAGNVRRWLNDSFPIIDYTGSEFKDKVQEALDQRFGSGFFIRIDEEYDDGDQKFEIPVAPKEYDASPDYQEIIRRVVQRKDLEFEELRPGIQNLGREKVMLLVKNILNDIAHGNYEQNKTAKVFGASKSAMSRFAGTNWQVGQKTVPDLWRNAIRVILAKPEFTELATENGLEYIIKKLTATDTRA
jgi:hypothetical protein